VPNVFSMDKTPGRLQEKISIGGDPYGNPSHHTPQSNFS
jgi:hypothetical protein